MTAALQVSGDVANCVSALLELESIGLALATIEQRFGDAARSHAKFLDIQSRHARLVAHVTAVLRGLGPILH